MTVDPTHVRALLDGAIPGPWRIAAWNETLVIDQAWDDFDRRGCPKPIHDLMTAACARRGDAELIAAAPEIAEAYLAASQREATLRELLTEARPILAAAWIGSLLERVDVALAAGADAS